MATPDLLTASSGFWRGHMFFIAAALSWAIYTVGSKAWKVDPLHGTAVVSVISMVVLLPIYSTIKGWQSLVAAPVVDVLVQAVTQGILTSIVALVAYNKAVMYLGAARAALFPILMPVVATVIAIPLLGEIPSWLEVVGILTICSGLVFALGVQIPRVMALSFKGG